MDEADSQLARLCGQIAATAEEAADWIERNKTGVGAKNHALRREFRQRAQLAKKYQRAALRPLCIGIFGPSQVGKSYLVSALARRGTNPLIAMLDRERDFLKEINPEKEQEATGLVTRFSIHASAAPRSHPVGVRLLSAIDLVKILANTYFLDFKPTEERVPSAKDIADALTEAHQRAGKGGPIDTLTDIDIDDLHSYCKERFAARRTIEALESGYWTQLEELAPKLQIEDRTKLYSFLWGRLPEITDIYLKLYSALRGLGFADEAYCPIEALVPREASILDVDTLKELTNPKGPDIEVLGNNGRRHKISRPYLTAIVAELLIQIKEAPWEYFNHTDVLDFPGARSRKQYEDPEKFVKKEGSLFDLFRRGKVAYLFDRYCDERELTGMLLCMQPGNQEVQTLPDMVLSWIQKSHGSTPADRAQVNTALFFVFSKFDRRFEISVGKQDSSSEERWSAAITTALTDFYGKNRDNWPREWHPNKPFNNSFWLRNPNFIAKGLMNYSSERKEIGLTDPAEIAKIKSEYLGNDAVRNHFKEPEKAWEAAFALNDGGITYLANSLAPVCKPELKRSQIEARLKELRRDLAAKLEEFHVSDNSDAERKKRVAAARTAVFAMKNVIESQHLGHFLSELQIGTDDLQFLFRRTQLSGDSFDGPVPPFDDIMNTIGLSPQGNGAPKQRDRFTHLADIALERWADRLLELPRQSQILTFLQIEAGTAETVVREVIAGGERIKLGAQIADGIRGAMPAIDSGAAEMLNSAMVTAERINSYVWKLGEDALPPAARAQINDANGQRSPVFKEREPVDTIDVLPEHGDVYYRPFIRDWLASFLHLVDQNATGNVKQKFSADESMLLNGIMQQLGG